MKWLGLMILLGGIAACAVPTSPSGFPITTDTDWSAAGGSAGGIDVCPWAMVHRIEASTLDRRTVQGPSYQPAADACR